VQWAYGKLAAAGALLAAVALGGCATGRAATPPLESLSQPSRDRGEGDALAKAIGPLADALFRLSRRTYDDPQLATYVSGVGERVAARAGGDGPRFEFSVFDDTEVNAWSIPRSRVYVSRATLAVLGSEAELAAVMAHEIAHQRLGHSMQSFRASTLGLEDLSCGSRLDWDQEYQADRLGLTLLHRAGYEPTTMFRMLRGLYASEDARDPESQARGLTRLARLARELEGRRGGEVNAERYLHTIDGLVWGEDPRNGVVRKGGWECARCGFALQLPKGWKLEGEPLSVKASSPRGDGRIELGGWPVLQAIPFASAAISVAQAQPFDQRAVAGMTAYVSTRSTGQGVTRFAVLVGRDRVWRLEGTGSGAARVDEVLAGMRTFTGAEMQESPQRIRVRRVQRVSSIREIARGLCEGKGPERTVGWLNGKELEERVDAGSLVKCIGP